MNSITKITLGTMLAFSPLLVGAQTTTTLAIPTHISPVDNTVLSTSTATFDWSDVVSGTSSLMYTYESSLTTSSTTDGTFSTPSYISSVLASSTITRTGMSDGLHYWHVRSLDTLGNISVWSPLWKVTIDTTAPTTPGVPIVITSTPPVTTTTPGTATTTGGIPLTTVQLHSIESDCWIIVSGKVYSVSGYISMHPGGRSAIVNQCGKDATTAFVTRGGSGSHSSSAWSLLNQYLVGTLASTTTTAPIVTVVANGSQTWSFSTSTDNLSLVSSYEYSVNGTTTWVSNALSTTIVTNLGVGTHTLSVRAIDGAGNKSPLATGSVVVTMVSVTATTTPTTPPVLPPFYGNLKEKRQCLKGGWRNFTAYRFKNQGKCISYAEKVEKQIKDQIKKQKKELELRKKQEDDNRRKSVQRSSHKERESEHESDSHSNNKKGRGWNS